MNVSFLESHFAFSIFSRLVADVVSLVSIDRTGNSDATLDLNVTSHTSQNQTRESTARLESGITLLFTLVRPGPTSLK